MFVFLKKVTDFLFLKTSSLKYFQDQHLENDFCSLLNKFSDMNIRAIFSLIYLNFCPVVKKSSENQNTIRIFLLHPALLKSCNNYTLSHAT